MPVSNNLQDATKCRVGKRCAGLTWTLWVHISDSSHCWVGLRYSEYPESGMAMAEAWETLYYGYFLCESYSPRQTASILRELTASWSSLQTLQYLEGGSRLNFLEEGLGWTALLFRMAVTWTDLEILAIGNLAPGRGVAPGGGLREAKNDTWGLAHPCPWDFMFYFYLNVFSPQGVYDKGKYEENRMEKEKLKALY